MSKILEQEIKTFERERARLEKDYMGKYVLIQGEAIIDTYDNFENAADEGLRRFGKKPFLIRRIGQDQETLSPAILLGITGADIKGSIQIERE